MQVVPGALAEASCRWWLARIDAAAGSLPPGHPDLQPTSDSLRLTALGPQDFEALLGEVAQGATAAAVQARLGEAVHALPGQCWARRQHPHALRPAGQAPHAWHQDGALHARFDGGDELLLPLVTVWVPLRDCGGDAPSLEWVDAPIDTLLPPPALTDDAVAARWGVAARRHARLAAGDALVFDGALLHRTHVAAAMTRRRVSIEFRCIADPGIHPRLADEPRRPWPR